MIKENMIKKKLNQDSWGQPKNDKEGGRSMVEMLGSLVLTLALTLAAVPSARADISYNEAAGACADGTGKMFIGNDGEKYCRSNIPMNWWSAFAWCDAAGGKLIPLERCNGKNGEILGEGDVACPNFKGKNTDACWTSSVPNTSEGYYLNSSIIYPRGRNTRSTNFALCE